MNKFRFLLLIFLLVLGCGSKETAMATDSDSEVPVETRRFVVADNSHDAFLRELDRFADANGFAIRVGNPGPTRRDVTVQMWREDLKLIAVNPFAPGEFRVSFYYNDSEHVPPEFVKGLADQLTKGAISVPGVVLDDRRGESAK